MKSRCGSASPNARDASQKNRIFPTAGAGSSRRCVKRTVDGLFQLSDGGEPHLAESVPRDVVPNEPKAIAWYSLAG
jgi:hypothetical protein